MPSATRIPRNALGTRMLLCLMLLAVVLRAMIPVGYMPDTAALRQGIVRIGLCTSTGMVPATQFLRGEHAGDGQAHMGHMEPMAHMGHMAQEPAAQAAMDQAGHDHSESDHSGSDHAAGAECPFWAAAHLAADLPPLAIVPLLAALRDGVVRFAVPAALPALPPAGPPLGSRAPPSA